MVTPAPPKDQPRDGKGQFTAGQTLTPERAQEMSKARWDKAKDVSGRKNEIAIEYQYDSFDEAPTSVQVLIELYLKQGGGSTTAYKILEKMHGRETDIPSDEDDSIGLLVGAIGTDLIMDAIEESKGERVG